jgi:hypothetical protein
MLAEQHTRRLSHRADVERAADRPRPGEIEGPLACTPASVRPAPCTTTVSEVSAKNACSSDCWIEAPFSCRCQPEKLEPSYSIVSL